MKLLFDLDIIEGNRLRARPSAYLQSLTPDEQHAAVTEFLHWAEAEVRSSQDPQSRAEAEIGIATAREFLDKLQPRIYTGTERGTGDDGQD